VLFKVTASEWCLVKTACDHMHCCITYKEQNTTNQPIESNIKTTHFWTSILWTRNSTCVVRTYLRQLIPFDLWPTV